MSPAGPRHDPGPTDNTWAPIDNTSGPRDNTRGLPDNTGAFRDNTWRSARRLVRQYAGPVQRRLVFIPIRADELNAIDGVTDLSGRAAHTVTPELLEELGYAPDDVEDAEYAAMVLASVAALARYGSRTVLVADVPADQVHEGPDPDNGGCLVGDVPSSAITCWFSEAPDVTAEDAAAAANGLDIDLAWGLDQVQDLLQHDLLWNDAAEFRRRNT